MTRHQRETSRGRIRGVSRELVQGARELRQQMTPAERLLWSHLRGSRLNGHKFRRQHPLGPYIVDFCCPDSRLIIELDGAVHLDQADYDVSRTEYLEHFGYLVLRFANDAVFFDISTVLRHISATASVRQRNRHDLVSRDDQRRQ